MSKKTFLPFLLLLSILLVQCKGSKNASTDTTNSSSPKSGVHFQNAPTLTDVLEEAERQNKLVFVDFVADWCLPCKLMDEEVFSHQPTADFLNDNFLSYKVNGEKGTGPNLVVVYQVAAYPTVMFMDARGKVLESKVGAVFHSELREMGQRALNSQL